MAEALATVRQYVPGFGLLVGIAFVARVIGGEVTALNSLLLSIGFGVIVANTYGVPEWTNPGVKCHKLFLETGIVFLGIRLTVGDLLNTGSAIAVPDNILSPPVQRTSNCCIHVLRH